MSLAVAGDVDVIWAVYVQYFRVVPHKADVPCFDNDNGQDTWAACSDLDVDYFQHLDDTALNNLLHFPEGRPSLFAQFRSISRKCAWDGLLEKDFSKNNPDMLPVTLLWHQRVGVAALVRKFWEVEKHRGGVPGVLIADEVGVGKTALIMGTIAFIIHAYWAEQLVRAPNGKPEALPATIDPSAMRVAPLLGELDSLNAGSQLDLHTINVSPQGAVSLTFAHMLIKSRFVPHRATFLLRRPVIHPRSASPHSHPQLHECALVL